MKARRSNIGAVLLTAIVAVLRNTRSWKKSEGDIVGKGFEEFGQRMRVGYESCRGSHPLSAPFRDL
jgi:hypothetical protein